MPTDEEISEFCKKHGFAGKYRLPFKHKHKEKTVEFRFLFETVRVTLDTAIVQCNQTHFPK